MPRWPGMPPSKRTCPKCGGPKDFDAATCRKCQDRPVGAKGRFGSDHPAWRGGRLVDRDGYVRLYVPDYEHRRKGPYMLEHVLVMERHLGRKLDPGETVHHKDHDRQNNHLSNLEVRLRGEHSRLHRSEDIHKRKRDDRGRFA